MKFQKIRGTADLLPEESYKWQHVEEKIQRLFELYNFKEVRLPIFEQYELFARGVGETSDIVSKEMYDFFDKGDRHIVLRPEGTAGVVRSFIENKIYGPQHHKPVKYYYNGPMFRFERPQSGRMRQFHQLGVEVFGSRNPALDVEIMKLAMETFNLFDLEELTLTINSLGNQQSRLAYREALVAYLTPFYDELSDDSKIRLEKNPLRILDSKDKNDIKIVSNAPKILDFLDPESLSYFKEVQQMLQTLDVAFEIDQNMVRGLDYYNDTIFEIKTNDPEFVANTTICAGGRYDTLVDDLGGPETPSFGFAIGLERLILLLDKLNYNYNYDGDLDAFIVTIGDEVNTEALKLAEKLRGLGLKVEREYLNRKPGAQFKTADRLNAKVVFTLGSSELTNRSVNMKRLDSGTETSINIDALYEDQNLDNLKKTYQKLKK